MGSAQAMLSPLVAPPVVNGNGTFPEADPYGKFELRDPSEYEPSEGFEGDTNDYDYDITPEEAYEGVFDAHGDDDGVAKASGADSKEPISSYNQVSSCPPSFATLASDPPSDHRFLSRPESRASRTWLKQIRKEYEILESSLPPGIFVRSWESRLDLFRVLIIGPEGTPYEYAPFVFDFFFPRKYPDVPPLAYFHSWTKGYGSVNPNLYEEGLVCLSILGTWGSDWSAGKSTVLQILVSIMGLVLVREPFYNEPGYDKTLVNHLAESREYTDIVFLTTRNFINHALLNPVAGLEDVLAWQYLSGPAADGQTRPQLLRVSVNSAIAMTKHYSNTLDEEIDEITNVVAPYIPRLSLNTVCLLKIRFIPILEEIEPTSGTKG